MREVIFQHPLLGGAVIGRIKPTNPHNSDVSAQDTAQWMYQLAQGYQGHPVVLWAVSDALKRIPQSATDETRLRALYYWVKRHVEYIPDENVLAEIGSDKVWDRELLLTPDQLLIMPKPMGDCKNNSLLIASMLGAMKVPYRFVTVAADDKEPNRLSHIYVKAFDSDKDCWFTLDAGVEKKYPGWEISTPHRKIEWQGVNGMLTAIDTNDDRECQGALALHRAGMQGCGDGLGADLSWSDVLKQGAQAGFNIVGQVLDPRFKPGTYSQTTPQGQVIQTAAQPSASFGLTTFPGGLPSTDTTMTYVLIGAAAIGALLLFSGRGK